MRNDSVSIPSKEQLSDAWQALREKVVLTPVLPWHTETKGQMLGPETEVYVKLELFQLGGSFKIRGALRNMQTLSAEELKRGVTAVSAGNHAIAVALAAQKAGTTAKVVMPSSANPARVDRVRRLGAELVLVDNVQLAFDETERIQREEGRTFVHPFEGENTVLGTAGVGWEFAEQYPEMEAVIIPIGGGGLAAGIAAAIHHRLPECRIFGVEPTGADSMSRSLKSGKPERIDKVRSIADSLGAPFAMPYTFGICQQLLEKVVLVEDSELRQVMRLMFEDMKLAPEPACAASLAALLGPLKEELHGKKVGVIACGANIDTNSFYKFISPST